MFGQALRAEVVRRQGALLSPEPGSEEAAMDPSIRQARLRFVSAACVRWWCGARATARSIRHVGLPHHALNSQFTGAELIGKSILIVLQGSPQPAGRTTEG